MNHPLPTPLPFPSMGARMCVLRTYSCQSCSDIQHLLLLVDHLLQVGLNATLPSLALVVLSLSSVGALLVARKSSNSCTHCTANAIRNALSEVR